MSEPIRRGRPHLYLFVFGAWALALLWFHPRLALLLGLAEGPLGYAALLFFITFVEFAWLFGFYNLGIVIFRCIYRLAPERPRKRPLAALPPVAILYTTCNDFVEASADSCLAQDYPDYTLYLLDDSSEPEFRARVDRYARTRGGRVRVVRRPDRRGFKAGNINHALAHAALEEPLFALVDADEILPPDFLRRTVEHLLADRECGFVQANHHSNPAAPGRFAADLGIGIDIHWRWYQPLRNRYGFVMLLGHGALIRRRCWDEAGGFPEVVSEDLAFAIRVRERGWYGYFAEDVVCYEDFPPTVRAFRVRHMKWTRGTCEFLHRELSKTLRSRHLSLVEKLDILFPTLNLPMAPLYLLFMVNANLMLATLFARPAALTLAWGGLEVALPYLRLDDGFRTIMTFDFFTITVMTILAPILCFVVELAPRPLLLLRFLGYSSALYATLTPLSALGVLAYLFTREATFLVTGEGVRHAAAARGTGGWLRRLLQRSHPDDLAVQLFEIFCGTLFAIAAIRTVQISFLGLAIGFVLLPLLHRTRWEHPLLRRLALLPFLLILAGLGVSALALVGIQPIFFGYGFHF